MATDDQRGTTSPSEEQRRQRIDEIVEACMARCAAGEVLDECRILDEHPELMPDLGERLRAMRMILAADGATVEAAQRPSGEEDGVPPLMRDAIPGYELVREVHHGGQGAVYLAIQKATRRKVAVKIMREGLFGDSKGKARFEREVRILAALRHPNILAIHDSGLAACGHYFVMDYISGLPLDRYVREKNLSNDDVLCLFRTVCEAVNTAHLKGIVHRDLKPGNILVDDPGTPYVLDFGLARVAAGDVAGETRPQIMTATGQFVGSLPWSAPEQAEGKSSKIDMRTDVYSLGVVLYQLLTGDFPYDVSGDMSQVISNILRAPPTRPSTIRRRLGADVETIVLKALAKERERRYQTAGDLARDIGHVLAAEPVEAKRASTLYVLSKSMRRHRVGLLATAGVILVAGGAAWMGHRWAGPPPVPDESARLLARVDARYEEEKERNRQARVPKELFEKPEASDAVDRDATLHRVLKRIPDHFSPYIDAERDPQVSQVTELLFDSLFLRTAWGGFEANPALLEGEPEWNKQRDKCTLRLRRDALWHDGKPVTPGDVRACFDFLQMTGSDEVELIQDLLVGDGCVTFQFKRPSTMSYANMNFALVPGFLFAEASKSAGGKTSVKNALTLLLKDKSKCVGCGPYRLDSGPSRFLKLERFQEYRGASPYFRTIIFHIEPKPENWLQMISRGEIDECELTDEQYSNWGLDAGPTGSCAVSFSRNQYNVVLWNLNARRGLFGDRRVRQALANAFNLSAAMREAGLDPRDQVAGVFPVRSWMYELLPETYGYAPDQAQRLLRDAGWELRDGIRVTTGEDGQTTEFRFSIAVVATSSTSRSIMEAFSKDLRKIGVLAKVETKTPEEWEGIRGMNLAFDAVVTGIRPGIDPALDRVLWHSGKVGKTLTPVSCGYKNERVDALFDEADDTIDMAARRELYLKLQQLIYEDQPVMFLYHRPAKWALSKRLRGVEFGIRGPFGFYPGVRAWWTPKTPS